MAAASSLADLSLLAGRVLFAVVVGYLALGNLRDVAGSIAYAESKGVPFPGLTVPAGSVLLLAGSLSILLGVYPVVGALAVAGFLVPVTVTMHDFWNAEGQAAENERVHFLKNVGLLGATLVLLALPETAWSSVLALAA